jgi:hypothetical protein
MLKKTIVVIKAFDKFKVGLVIGMVSTDKDVLYQVKTEDGKIYDDIKIDDFKSAVYIHNSITNSFLKSKK